MLIAFSRAPTTRLLVKFNTVQEVPMSVLFRAFFFLSLVFVGSFGLTPSALAKGEQASKPGERFNPGNNNSKPTPQTEINTPALDAAQVLIENIRNGAANNDDEGESFAVKIAAERKFCMNPGGGSYDC